MRLRYPLLLALVALALAPLAHAQAASGDPIYSVLINEVDADQSGTDAAEFVELYNPTGAPVDLSGGVLVFFNGSDDASYNAVDLDGFSIPAGGYFVYCGDMATVDNCDLEVGAGTTNLIQNGADAVALYAGEAASFPEDTPVTMTGLVDALVYGTADGDDSGLLDGLGETTQYDEDATGNKDTESTQRSPDGAEAYVTAEPTPGATNAVAADPLAEILINEVDADQSGTDAAEFVELYNPTGAPVDLSGGVLVFFNGSDDASYNAVDLDGFSIPAGGYFVYCGDMATVDNCDLDVGAGTTNLIQNGADAVALYAGEAASFPEDTPVTMTGLVDALVYGTADGDDSGLLDGLGETTQYDEDATGNKDTESTQRSPDGAEAYITAGPTPGAANAVIVPETYTAYLLGLNEVPAVETGAAGGVTATLTGTELVVEGRFAGLESDYNAAVGSHLHGGAVGENGGVRYVLMPTLDADNRGGRFEAENNTFSVRTTFADSLRNGLVYVNVHSTDDGGGEVRGQLLSDPDPADVTLEQARNIGAGYAVAVSGTVSRAMGAFTYMQDATGGLVIRQTGGAFNGDVAGGTITTGTTLDVTGELSEFNSLLQINGSDLVDYTVTGSTDAPEARVVTLADIAANGEAFESMLLSVRGLTFDAAGGTFEAGQNYDVADASGGMVQVRVIGADDTEVDGMPIPGGNSNVTGVLGQYDPDAPFTDGYQLQPILASDVEVATGTGEDAARAGAMLAVENPARGSVSVRFDAGQAGRATVTVFDAVGRQVAVLAEGEVPAGERSVELDAAALAAGVYIVRLEVASGALTRVVTVVR